MWQCGKCDHVFKDNRHTHCVLCGGERRPPSQAAKDNAILRYFSNIAGIKYVALSTHEERSSFAHQILESKLSPKHQAQLCIFFTEYLNSGWEDSGGTDATDDGKWGDCSGTVVASPVYAGSYACSFDEGDKAELYSLNLNACYVRCYMRTNDVTSRSAVIDIYDSGYSEELWLGFEDGEWLMVTGLFNNYYAGSLSINTWYCIELYRNTSANENKAWLDGGSLFDETDTVTGNTGNIMVGCSYSDGTPTVVIDCVVVADAPIGCLLSTETETITVDTLLQSLETETLTVDTILVTQHIETFTMDSRLFGTFTETMSVDSLLQQSNLTETVIVDTLLQQEGLVETFTVDSYPIRRLTSTLITDSMLQAGQTATFTVSAAIRQNLGDQALCVVHSNIQPDKAGTAFLALTGGKIYLQNYKSGNIGNVKFWVTMIPFTQFDDIYLEAEDGTLAGGADTEDVSDDINESARLNAQNENVYWDLNALPAGRYIVLVRAKDTNQVASDCQLSVENTTDGEYRNQENNDVLKTLTGSFAYYQLIFDITSTDVSDVDNIRITALKATATSNTIYIDYFLIIPITNGEGWPQDIADNVLRNIGQTFRPKQVV